VKKPAKHVRVVYSAAYPALESGFHFVSDTEAVAPVASVYFLISLSRVFEASIASASVAAQIFLVAAAQAAAVAV